jgi:hypothetical protein
MPHGLAVPGCDSHTLVDGLELWSKPAIAAVDDEGVDLFLFGIGVDDELEPIAQQGARSGRIVLFCVLRGTRLNIKAIRPKPARSAGELKIADSVGIV